MKLTIPVGHRPRRGHIDMHLETDGSIQLVDRTPRVTGEEVPHPDNVIRLTFDEAEALAAGLRDLARIVRVQHGLGFSEVG